MSSSIFLHQIWDWVLYVPASLESVGLDTCESGPHHPSKTTTISKKDADEKDAPQVYKGHGNCKTVKVVSFLGPDCKLVASGSDCKKMFIWKKSAELIHAIEADKHVVNCIELHPQTMAVASCGIENDIKIWTPKTTSDEVMG